MGGESRQAGARASCAVIIPAYNEGSRVGKVIEAARAASLVSEVIVVSDGSTDDTADVARSMGARVIELPRNVGKGGALKVGIDATTAEVLAFIDADLIGLAPRHVDDLIRPVANGEADATLGTFAGGRAPTSIAQRITPGLSGQRALRASLVRGLAIEHAGFGVEVVLNKRLASAGARVRRVALEGVSQFMKEEKRGGVEGFASRLRMYWEILKHAR